MSQSVPVCDGLGGVVAVTIVAAVFWAVDCYGLDRRSNARVDPAGRSLETTGGRDDGGQAHLRDAQMGTGKEVIENDLAGNNNFWVIVR
jgi:hypothetical protein